MSPINLITPDALSAYLSAARWQRVVSDNRRTIWLHSPSESRVFVPERLGPDFVDVVELAIRQIARAEQRDEDDILIDLVWHRFDKLHLRREANGSALPLADAMDLQEAFRDLILAGARAAEEARPTFRGRRPAAVEEYMDEVRLIPSVPGSFVLRALLPLTRRAEQEPLPLTGPAAPVVRKVATTIIDATHSAVEAAIDVAKGAPLQRWEETVPHGVSSNLCDALSRLPSGGDLGIRGNAELRIDWTWAAPEQPIRPVVVATGVVPILAAASDYLQGEEEEHTVRVTGLVIRLHRDVAVGPGQITVRGHVEGMDSGTRTLRFDLDEAAYREAIHAHDRGISVRVTALIRREAKGLRTIRVEDLQLLKDAES